MRRFSNGQGLVEYALILVLVSLVTGVTVTAFGGDIAGIYEGIVSDFKSDAASPIEATPTVDSVEEAVPETIEICENDTELKNAWTAFSTDESRRRAFYGNSKNDISFGEELCLSNTGSYESFAFNKCSKKQNVSDDYTVSFGTAELAAGEYGVMVRMKNYSKNGWGYALRYDQEKDVYVLNKLTNGKATALAVGTVPEFNPYATTHTVEVEVKGSTITAYVNGIEILSVVDSTYTSGGAGIQLSGDGAQACFSDFSVKTVID